MANPRNLTLLQVPIIKHTGASSLGVKMLSLLRYQYLLVILVSLSTFSTPVSCGSCSPVCDGQFNKCMNSLSTANDANGCINEKFECFKKCQIRSRVKKDTEFARDQAVMFYYLQSLCTNYCKTTYDRIDSVCTRNCLEKHFHGRFQGKNSKL